MLTPDEKLQISLISKYPLKEVQDVIEETEKVLLSKLSSMSDEEEARAIAFKLPRLWCDECKYYECNTPEGIPCPLQLDYSNQILAITNARKAKPLFETGDFELHSGDKSNFLINCDTLTEDDWKTLSMLIAERCKFKDVWGIPEGGLKLRDYLSFYCTDDESLPTLIVDDVLTTGASMEKAKEVATGDVIGWVVFARGKCPDWVTPLSNWIK